MNKRQRKKRLSKFLGRLKNLETPRDPKWSAIGTAMAEYILQQLDRPSQYDYHLQSRKEIKQCEPTEP